MFRILNFCLLIIIQIVSSEPVPPHCAMPPPEVTNPEKCCNLPQVFKEEDFKECGIEVPFDDKFKMGPPDCSQQKCLLKKYNLMKDDNEIDKDALLEFMNKWVETSADFKDAIEKAKEICVINDQPGPPHICEPTEVFFCIDKVMYTECPKWEDTDICQIMKYHIEECKAYSV